MDMKGLLIKELREYLDKVEKDETTFNEMSTNLIETIKDFNCGD